MNDTDDSKKLAKMYNYSSEYLVQSDTDLRLFIDENGDLSYKDRYSHKVTNRYYDLEEDLMSACVKTALIKLISKELIDNNVEMSEYDIERKLDSMLDVSQKISLSFK